MAEIISSLIILVLIGGFLSCLVGWLILPFILGSIDDTLKKIEKKI